MSRSGAVVVHDDAGVLAEAVASRLIHRLADAQAQRGEASAVLTGGRIAARVYANVLASPIRSVVDWSKVDFWWGDERFLPTGDPERNEVQAREAFLDRLPVDPARVHPMPSADEFATPEEAAAKYAEDLAAAARAGARGGRAGTQAEPGVPSAPAGAERLPAFDLLLLGIGEDGHVASLFPGNPALDAQGAVAGVRDSPKPPPERVSLTLEAINTATAAWIIASGTGKADAVDEALAKRVLPAGRVQAAGHTRWLIDEEAAARLKHFEF